MLFVPSPSEYLAVCTCTLSFHIRSKKENDEEKGGVPPPRPQRASYNRCYEESKSFKVGILFASI